MNEDGLHDIAERNEYRERCLLDAGPKRAISISEETFASAFDNLVVYKGDRVLITLGSRKREERKGGENWPDCVFIGGERSIERFVIPGNTRFAPALFLERDLRLSARLHRNVTSVNCPASINLLFKIARAKFNFPKETGRFPRLRKIVWRAFISCRGALPIERSQPHSITRQLFPIYESFIDHTGHSG